MNEYLIKREKKINDVAMSYLDSLSKLEYDFEELRKKTKLMILELVCEDDNEDYENQNKECYLYYILNEDKDLVKIGVSSNVKSRIKNMQTSTGYYLNLIHTIKFKDRNEAMKAESFLHRKFNKYRRTPHKDIKKTSEWFDSVIVDDLMSKYDTSDRIQKAFNKYESDYFENSIKVANNLRRVLQ